MGDGDVAGAADEAEGLRGGVSTSRRGARPIQGHGEARFLQEEDEVVGAGQDIHVPDDEPAQLVPIDLGGEHPSRLWPLCEPENVLAEARALAGYLTLPAAGHLAVDLDLEILDVLLTVSSRSFPPGHLKFFLSALQSPTLEFFSNLLRNSSVLICTKQSTLPHSEIATTRHHRKGLVVSFVYFHFLIGAQLPNRFFDTLFVPFR